MEQSSVRDSKVWTWCFWIAATLVFVVFVVPVETKTVTSGNGSEVTLSYTLWNKLTGKKPSSAEFTFRE